MNSGRRSARSAILGVVATSNDTAVQRAESGDNAWDELASQIKEGFESGPAAPMTESDWKEVEVEIHNAAKPSAER